MQTSPDGIAFLERHEGVVLRAYRCPAGVWTIGAGLTAASGVVRPAAGMAIGRAEASRLLALALGRNYEPAVARAMPGAAQHAFDAGVSFHFNTGAIARASWVGRWRVRDWPATHAALRAWNKGGGRVLPGLVRRREEEFLLLKTGSYGRGTPVRPMPAPGAAARLAAPVTASELPAIRSALARLGYPVGATGGQIAAETVRAFQADHGLTVDGVVGRATASALQRVLDARAKAGTTGAAGAAAAADAGLPPLAEAEGLIEALSGASWAGWLVAAFAAARLAWLAWDYRDALAPWLDDRAPALALWLRER
ncbi:MAG: glycoside hydrolase family protein [Gemmobacter sp.]